MCTVQGATSVDDSRSERGSVMEHAAVLVFGAMSTRQHSVSNPSSGCLEPTRVCVAISKQSRAGADNNARRASKTVIDRPPQCTQRKQTELRCRQLRSAPDLESSRSSLTFAPRESCAGRRGALGARESSTLWRRRRSSCLGDDKAPVYDRLPPRVPRIRGDLLMRVISGRLKAFTLSDTRQAQALRLRSALQTQRRWQSASARTMPRAGDLGVQTHV
ncbi:hypothetical protein ON010_g11449 [Phytophthora cinnamomi]|nr:hypothetical protein ON010_g11449 [Phytophthora cinnamomi]